MILLCCVGAKAAARTGSYKQMVKYLEVKSHLSDSDRRNVKVFRSVDVNNQQAVDINKRNIVFFKNHLTLYIHSAVTHSDKASGSKYKHLA